MTSPLIDVDTTHLIPNPVHPVPRAPDAVVLDLGHVTRREVGVDLTVQDEKDALTGPGVIPDPEIAIDQDRLKVIGEGVEGCLEVGVVVVIEGGTGGEGHIHVIGVDLVLVIGSLDTVPDLPVVGGDGTNVDDLLPVIEVGHDLVPETVGGEGPIPGTDGGATDHVPDPGSAIVSRRVGEV